MKRKLLFLATILCFVFIASTSFAAPVLSVGDYLGNPGGTLQASIDISGITTEEIADFTFGLSIVPEDGGLLIGDPANVAKGGSIG